MSKPSNLIQGALDVLILKNPLARTQAWLGHRATHPAGVARCAADSPGIALSRAPPPGTPGLDPRGMARNGRGAAPSFVRSRAPDAPNSRANSKAGTGSHRPSGWCCERRSKRHALCQNPLHALPVSEPHRLVIVSRHDEQHGWDTNTLGYPMYRELARQMRSFPAHHTIPVRSLPALRCWPWPASPRR